MHPPCLAAPRPRPADSSNADASGWAPRCPQAFDYPSATSTQSEDCLYLTLWAPKGAANLPVYAFLPGGSNFEGSSSDDGLDGAALAAHGLLVASIQHRTGVLGFLPPKSAKVADPNFALRDVLLALRAIKDNVVGAGGDPGAVTLGGHSSGAHLAHSLLGAPDAAGLFQRLLLQSDPLNTGAQTAAQTAQLQDAFYGNMLAGCTSLACARGKTAAQLMGPSHDLSMTGFSLGAGIPFGLTLRPQLGTPTLPADPLNALWAGNVRAKPAQVLITNTRHEAGAIATIFTPPPTAGMWASTPAQQYAQAVAAQQGSARQPAIVAQYPLGGQGVTEGLEAVFTAGGFRCPARDAAGKLAQHATVYVAEITQGTAHAKNAPFPYCADHVCHNNDLYAWFGTGPNGADAFSAQVMGHVAAFVKTGNPGWGAFPDAGVHTLGSGAPGDCPAGFWGETAKYDFQLYSQ